MNDTAPAAAPRMPETGRGLAKFGVLGSIVWLLIAVGYSIYARAEFKDLQPNEIGDFLAGVFAPLAFFWLVLGFLQQGAELRNSGQALWLQGEELRNSVEQQRQLVDVTREQLAFESSRITTEQHRAKQLAQPKFQFSLGGSVTSSSDHSSTVQEFYLTNHGALCTRVSIAYDDHTAASMSKLQTGDRMEFRRKIAPDFCEAAVRVTYLDGHQEEGLACFKVSALSPGVLEVAPHPCSQDPGS